MQNSTAPAGAHMSSPGPRGTMNNDQPALPKWLFFVHIVQILLALLILALSAYALSVYSPGGAYLGYVNSALGFAIFCAIWTFIVVGALIVIPRFAPKLYYKWILLSGIAIATLFWLIGFSLLASWANGLNYGRYNGNIAKRSPKSTFSGSSSSSSSDYTYSDSLDDYDKLLNRVIAAWRCICAAAAFGAVLWVLFVVTLVFYALACHKYRMGSGPNPGVEGGVGASGVYSESKGNEMHNYNQQQQAPAYAPTPNPMQQQQQQYPQYAQSEVTYAPTPNPEQQFQQQRQYMPEQPYTQQHEVPQQPAPSQQQTYTNPQFGGQNQHATEMPSNTSTTQHPN